MTRQQRKEFDALSMKIFNRSTTWKKYLDRGEKAEMIEILEDGTERKYIGMKYPTIEDVKIRLDELLKEKEEKDAKKAEEDRIAAEEAKNAQDTALNTMVSESQKLGLYDETKS